MLERLIFTLLNHFIFGSTQWFFGVGQGASGEQKQQYGIMTNLENFGISSGEKDISKSQDFWSSILSGDPTQISKVLGPEFSAINKQTQQQKKTTAEFGNRGGGTNALMQNLDTQTLGQVRGLLSGLTGTAAGQLGGMGQSLLGVGATAGAQASSEADTMQKENAAKWNDIFQSISDIAGAAGGFFGKGTEGRKIFGGIAGAIGG
jgi:hypothetical protein